MPYGATMEENTMPKARRFSLEQIHAMLKKLRSLPPKKVGKTRAEAVECLTEDIRKAVKKGHSLSDENRRRTGTQKRRQCRAGSRRNGGLRTVHNSWEKERGISGKKKSLPFGFPPFVLSSIFIDRAPCGAFTSVARMNVSPDDGCECQGRAKPARRVQPRQSSRVRHIHGRDGRVGRK